MAERTYEIYGQDIAPGLLLFLFFFPILSPLSCFHHPAFTNEACFFCLLKKMIFLKLTSTLLAAASLTEHSSFYCPFGKQLFLSSPSFLVSHLVFIAFTFITSSEERHQCTQTEERIASSSLSLILWASAALSQLLLSLR